ncbi:MAG: hypothetical protein Q9178_004874 [Gyalolechia marmorata]
MADYQKLAGMMANHGEVAIFRRFDKLNLKNLLYMQAELILLEAELHQMELDEKSAVNSSKPAYPFSVDNLREAACSGKVTQWTKYQEVQSKLQAYNGAVMQYLALRKVVKPDANSVECLREWLDRPEGGDFFLKGREAETWEEVEDFVSLDYQQPRKDALTRLINEKFVPWYHRRWVHRFKMSPPWSLDDSRLDDHSVLFMVGFGDKNGTMDGIVDVDTNMTLLLRKFTHFFSGSEQNNEKEPIGAAA